MIKIVVKLYKCFEYKKLRIFYFVILLKLKYYKKHVYFISKNFCN